MEESRPDPISAADDTIVPAMIAMTASIRLYPIVAATIQRMQRWRTSFRVPVMRDVAVVMCRCSLLRHSSFDKSSRFSEFEPVLAVLLGITMIG